MQPLRTIGRWLEHRLQLGQTLLPVLKHPVPAALAGPAGWWYVFGSMTMTLFVVQVITGICLSMVYVPAADEAYNSLLYLNYQVQFGWLIRAVHNWSATGMIIMLAVHMTQVFLMGAFKYPRELTWLVGVGLLVVTLGLAFTGQVLRWDSDSYWGVGVGVSALGRVPLIGNALVKLLMGGEFIGSATLSRFFSLHVFVLPAALIGLLVVHLYLVVRQGVSEPPESGAPVDPDTYDEKYEGLLRRGIPFFPHALYRDGVACALLVLVVLTVSIVVGPKGPGEPPDPTLVHAEPRPDWYFLPAFALLALSPPAMETLLLFGLPVVGLGVLLAVPILAGRGERSPRQRPVAVLCVIMAYTLFGILGYLGYTAPWSPELNAWSGKPVPREIVQELTPVELKGAVVFQYKSCRNCHSLDGVGGHRGPDLTDVGARLNQPDLNRQVVQGGGNMPAYAQQLSSDEVDALVAFLVRLRPEGQPPAQVPTPLTGTGS